jgi:hypothetical protein
MYQNECCRRHAVACDSRGAEPGGVWALGESSGRAGGVYPRAGAGDAIGSPAIVPIRRGCDGACDIGGRAARPGRWDEIANGGIAEDYSV